MLHPHSSSSSSTKVAASWVGTRSTIAPLAAIAKAATTTTTTIFIIPTSTADDLSLFILAQSQLPLPPPPPPLYYLAHAGGTSDTRLSPYRSRLLARPGGRRRVPSAPAAPIGCRVQLQQKIPLQLQLQPKRNLQLQLQPKIPLQPVEFTTYSRFGLNG